MRVSVSSLETYRYYKDNEDITLEQCLADLRKETPPKPAMLAGSALHRILENADYSDVEAVTVKGDGYHFHFDCDVNLSVPIVRELKGELEIETPSGPVTLVGVVDGMDTAVIDYKLTGRFEAEKFADSYQWRCYLLMFHANRFDYRVFVGKEKSAGTDFEGEPFSDWTITEYHELPVYRYPDMEQDVTRIVSEYAAFANEYLN